MRKVACLFCGAPSTLLCDGYLGYPPKTEDGLEFIDPFHPYTCDAPLCSDCAVQQGKMHICSRGRGGGCRTETTDYCPVCVRDIPPYPQRTRRLIYSPEQAITIRAAHWAGYSNEHHKRLKSEQGGGQQCLDL